MSRKLKILEINKLYFPETGGIERVIQQIAEGLADKTDMKVLACQRKGKGKTEVVNGVKVRKSGSLGIAFSMPISLSFFMDFIRMRKDRDIIHIHMPFPLADVAVCLLGFNGKVVLWWHSDVIRQKRLMRFYRPFLIRLLKRADLIIAATQGHIDDSEFLPDYREKCVVIPYGVEKKMLDASGSVGHQKKTDKNRQTTFLFVGRFVYYKGCEVLLEAFANLNNARLVMVGEGPLQKQLQSMSESLNINKSITWLSRLSDSELSNVFQSCDVFVLPSIAKSEAFGLVQIEAMAHGKPVINTRLPGGVPYVSLDGQTGLTIPPSDVNALSDAMKLLQKDIKMRESMGRAAYTRAHEVFTVDKMLCRLLDAFTLLMD